MQIRFLPLLILLPLWGAHAQSAQQPADSLRTRQLKEVEVTHTRQFASGAPALSTLSVQERQLAQGMANNLAQALDKQAGLSVMATGVGVAKPVLRGMLGNRLVVHDGIGAQQDQQWGNDHGLAIDPFGIEALEVAKGASALRYGGDAIGGVIQLQLPSLPDREGVHGSASTLYRSNNHAYGASLLAEGRKGDAFFQLRASTQHFGNYRVPADSAVYLGTIMRLRDRELVNTGGREQSAQLALGLDRSTNHSLLLLSLYDQLGGLFPGAVGIPSQGWLDSFSDSRKPGVPRSGVRHLKVGLKHDRQLSEHSKLNLQLGYQHNRRREESDPRRHGRPMGPNGYLAGGLDLHTLSAQTDVCFTLSEKLDVIGGLGGEWQQHRRSGFDFLLPDYQQWKAGLFLLAHYHPAEAWMLEAGLRADLGQVQIESYRDAQFPTQDGLGWERVPQAQRQFQTLSASAGATYQPEGGNGKFSLQLARSMRMPTVPELALNGVHHGTFRHEQGTLSLRPEVGYQLDLSAQWQWGKLSWGLSPFLNYFQGYIFLMPSGEFSPLPDAGQIYRYAQSDGLHTGLESELRWEPLPSLQVGSVLEYVWAQDLERNLPFPFMPPLNHLLEVGYTFKNVGILRQPRLVAEWQWSAAQERVARNEPATPAYHRINLGASSNLHLGGVDASLFFRLENLLNTPYLHHLSRYRILNLPEQGRNMSVGMKVMF